MSAIVPEESLTRPAEGRVVAGVAAGLGRRFGVDAAFVRVAFVVLAAASGIGFVLYAIGWAFVPSSGASLAPAAEPRLRWERGTGRVAAGLGLLVLSLLLCMRELGIWWSDALVWPAVLATSGAAIIWRQVAGRSETLAEAAPPPAAARREQRAAASRAGFGAALVLGAGLLFLYANGALDGAAQDALLAGVVVLVAVALILAPLWWRLGRNLAGERAERIRSQERAEVAAHLHDSVLQTLALVQRRADDPRAVAALARRQERELRAWLWPGASPASETSVAQALSGAAAEVEDAHGAAIDVVTVGDSRAGPETDALVAAAREAMVNAAKFAGEHGPIAVYAELAEDRAQVFVRDRGEGYEPADVPADRRGISDSIVARMRRHGGSAVIRAVPGEGVEVELAVGGGRER